MQRHCMVSAIGARRESVVSGMAAVDLRGSLREEGPLDT
jgi:hypothetical protein